MNEDSLTLGIDFYTIEQLSGKAKQLALITYRQKKEYEFWSTKPIADDSTDKAWELEFEMLNTEDILIKELNEKSIFFKEDGKVYLKKD